MSDAAKQRLEFLREPDFENLDPGMLRLFRDDSGRLRLVVQDNRSYLEVKVVRAFPFSDPDRFIGLLDACAHDRSIGFIESLDALDVASRQAAEEALRRHYFIPTVQSVLSLREEYGAVYVDVDTNSGRRHFVAKGLRDAIVDLGDGELLIADVDGNRYRIADWRQLDTASRRFLERVV